MRAGQFSVTMRLAVIPKKFFYHTNHELRRRLLKSDRSFFKADGVTVGTALSPRPVPHDLRALLSETELETLAEPSLDLDAFRRGR